ncbi:MAG: hypothetical protein IT423_02485 [Pirellulaceae bacterium]|nr:hypothetical protein [Pirellulaceae bacterium]
MVRIAASFVFLSWASSAIAQFGNSNFGTNVNDFGNAGGFATGSGFSNGSTGSNFNSAPFGSSRGRVSSNNGYNLGSNIGAYSGSSMGFQLNSPQNSFGGVNGGYSLGDGSAMANNLNGFVGPSIGFGFNPLNVDPTGGLLFNSARDNALNNALNDTLGGTFYGGAPFGLLPGAIAPGFIAPGMVAPGMVASGMFAPGMLAPGMLAPGMLAPGMYAPGMMNDGLATGMAAEAALGALQSQGGDSAAMSTPSTPPKINYQVLPEANNSRAANQPSAIGQRSTQSTAQSTTRASAQVLPVSSPAARQLEERVRRIRPRASFQQVTVLLAGRTAVLRGYVPTKAAAELVERMVALEPNVNSVDNQLTYPERRAAPTATPATANGP